MIGHNALENSFAHSNKVSTEWLTLSMPYCINTEI